MGKVTDALHHKGGRIVLQLMHVGRIGHPWNSARRGASGGAVGHPALATCGPMRGHATHARAAPN